MNTGIMTLIITAQSNDCIENYIEFIHLFDLKRTAQARALYQP